MRTLVPSRSHPGQSHAVDRDGDLISCECIRFQTSQGMKECGHVKLVLAADKLLMKCAEVHGLNLDGRLCRDCLVALLARVKYKAEDRAREARREGKAKAREEARARKERAKEKRRGQKT